MEKESSLDLGEIAKQLEGKQLFSDLLEQAKEFTEKVVITYEIKNMSTIIATAGAWCPSCKEDGGMFHYPKNYLSYKPDPFHLCENCCKCLTDEEYIKLLNENPKPTK